MQELGARPTPETTTRGRRIEYNTDFLEILMFIIVTFKIGDFFVFLTQRFKSKSSRLTLLPYPLRPKKIVTFKLKSQ